MHPIFRADQRPLVLGHRGVPRLHQENSLAGFQRAVGLGLDGVELDVFVTRDDRIVVFHDLETERLTSVAGCICDMTWDEITRLRLQKQVVMGRAEPHVYEEEARIPLLEEVLSEFSGKLLINIELKAYGVSWRRRHTGALVGRILRDMRLEERVIVTSFDPLMLYALQRENPAVHFGFAWDDDMFGGIRRAAERVYAALPGTRPSEAATRLQQTLGNRCMELVMGHLLESKVVGMEQSLIGPESVARAHARGLAVGAYTLFPLDLRSVRRPQSESQDRRQIAALQESRIDWIETDDGERVLALLARNNVSSYAPTLTESAASAA
jgi:glycerophosphoryl diester phosphodiesterase